MQGAEERAEPPAVGSLGRVKVAVVVAVVAALLFAHRLGLFEVFGEPARIKDALLALGPWGYVAFVAAYAALQPFGVPGTVFIVAAPLVWPWPVAFGLSMAGTMAASVIGFSFARFVARDWVARFIPARFRSYDEALKSRGFSTVFTLRFIFWMPPMLHVFFGVSGVGFWTHFWGSLAGYVVPLLAVSYFGERLFEMMRAATPGTWAAVVAATALVLVTGFFVRRSIRARR